MKTTLKNLSREGLRYEAPSLEIIELAAEGVLCASGDKTFSLPEWEYDNTDDGLDW